MGHAAVKFSIRKRKSLMLAIFTGLVFLCSSCSREKEHYRVTGGRTFGGNGWLAWTPDERTRYVSGIIEGYQYGYAQACDDSNHSDLFKDKLPYVPGDENLLMVAHARCRTHLQKFSKAKFGENGTDVQFYTSTVTELYQKYPDARSAPYMLLLLELMHDGGPENADQLYKAQLGKWPNARIE